MTNATTTPAPIVEKLLATRTDPRLAGVCLLDVRQVADLLGVHARTVWRMAAMDELPKPIKLSERVVRWRLADLERHIRKARPA